MAFKWSYSTHQRFRQCERQFFFQDVFAYHGGKDAARREAFIRKQLKTIPLWRGTLIHTGIEDFVVPRLKRKMRIDWKEVVRATLERMERQYEFSKVKRYRDNKVTKSGHKESYCALEVHDRDEDLSAEDLDELRSSIRSVFATMEAMEELWIELGRIPFAAETRLNTSYHGARIEVIPDILARPKWGAARIYDWKVYDNVGGSQARQQMALYGWVLYQQPDRGFQSPEHIELVEVQGLTGQLERYTCTEDLFFEIEDLIFESLERMRLIADSRRLKDNRLEDFDYAGNPTSCEFCNYRPLCLPNGIANVNHAARAATQSAEPDLFENDTKS